MENEEIEEGRQEIKEKEKEKEKRFLAGEKAEQRRQ